MKKSNRIIIVSLLVAPLLLAGFFFGFNSLSSAKKPPPRKAPIKDARAITTTQVENQNIDLLVPIQGRLIAYDKVILSSEVSGVIKPNSKPFKVGTRYQKDELIFTVDDTEARLNILALKSQLQTAITQMLPDLKIDMPDSYQQWQSYINAFDINASVRPLPSPLSDREKYFVNIRNLHNLYYSIKSSEERLRKYRIYAPFSGVITLANVNEGAMIAPGQALGQLMNVTKYELEGTVPVADLKYLKVGSAVTLFSTDLGKSWKGTIKRISDQIDPASQLIKVYVGVSGSGLKEGLYLEGEVKGGKIDNVFSLPRNLLLQGEKVLIVEQDSLLGFEEVKVLRETDEHYIVEGLSEGTSLVNENIKGAFKGMNVKVSK